MSLLTWIAWTAGLSSAVMVVAWVMQRRLNDAGIVDVLWSGSLGIAAIGAAIVGEGDPLRRMVLNVIAVMWSFRLTLYLLTDRILKAEREDGRYQMLRQKWGDSAQVWLFVFFQAQAFFVVAFAIPFYVVAQNPLPLGWLDGLGVAIWIIAMGGETLADLQLSRHRADPANQGKTCRSGLWRYSRHPNYFFEWLHWWSYVFLGLGSAWWYLAPSAAMFMLFLLFFITGIPYTEQRAIVSRGQDYIDYQNETCVFIPWFPKRKMTP